MRLARVLPRRTGFEVFSAMGGAAGLLLREDHARAVSNLEIAFPETDRPIREAMTRAMFKSLGRNVFEFLKLAGSSKERISSLVERVEGREHLEGVRDANRGVLVITGHIGCWELLAAYWATQGYAVNVVGRELWEKRLDRELIKIRQTMGYRTVDRDRGAKEMLRILRNNGFLAVLIDQHTRVDGIYVPFFNRPAHTPTGVARMAHMTGALILPMAIYMNQPGKHLIRILPPIECQGSLPRDQQVEVTTEKCSRAIEDLIRFDPKQWVWFHRRWRDEFNMEVGYASAN